MKVELTAKQERVIKFITNSTGLSLEEAVGACIEGVAAVLNKMTVSPAQETPKESVVEPSIVQPKKAWVVIDGIRYESDTFKGLLLNVIQALGCKRIYESYPEDARQHIFNHRPEDKKEKFGDYLEDGKYRYWVYSHISGKDVFTFIKNASECLGLKITGQSNVESE